MQPNSSCHSEHKKVPHLLFDICAIPDPTFPPPPPLASLPVKAYPAASPPTWCSTPSPPASDHWLSVWMHCLELVFKDGTNQSESHTLIVTCKILVPDVEVLVPGCGSTGPGWVSSGPPRWVRFQAGNIPAKQKRQTEKNKSNRPCLVTYIYIVSTFQIFV